MSRGRFAGLLMSSLVAAACLPPLAFFVLLLAEHHPLLVAGRGPSTAVYVPYWDVFPRPSDVFGAGPTTAEHNGLGLYFVRTGLPPDVRWNLWVEPWAGTVTFAVVPAVVGTAWLARGARALRRTPAGHCPRCGYDLRATPGRCPECGTVPA